MSRFLKDYLSFSRSEKNALIILGIIFILIFLLNIFLPRFIPIERKLTAEQLSEIKRIQTILDDTTRNFDSSSYQKGLNKSDYYQNDQTKNDLDNQVLFAFDPNTITIAEWQKLNVPEKAIKNIVKFRQKGGRFYKKEDLRKIYGLNEEVYDRLESYINIPSDIKKPNTSFNKLPVPVINIIELNSASESDLDKLPSIGESFAKRIVKYRQMLGGYYAKEQLLEVYGFDSIRFNKIKDLITIDESKIIKIAINLADIKQLVRHPYIGYKNAVLIVDKRNEKGLYQNIQELKDPLGNATYIKLSPYLKLWD